MPGMPLPDTRRQWWRVEFCSTDVFYGDPVIHALLTTACNHHSAVSNIPCPIPSCGMCKQSLVHAQC